MIISKEQIIEYFKSGIKEKKKFKIGIEHEKFLFNNKDNTRIDYLKIKEMFTALMEFGWNPILEKGDIVGLNNGDKIVAEGTKKVRPNLTIRPINKGSKKKQGSSGWGGKKKPKKTEEKKGKFDWLKNIFKKSEKEKK